jgi:hypothetical protein
VTAQSVMRCSSSSGSTSTGSATTGYGFGRDRARADLLPSPRAPARFLRIVAALPHLTTGSGALMTLGLALVVYDTVNAFDRELNTLVRTPLTRGVPTSGFPTGPVCRAARSDRPVDGNT